jgi:hypothetical protein
LTCDEVVVVAAVERPFGNSVDDAVAVLQLEVFADDWDGSRAKIGDIHDGTIEERVDGSSFLELRVNE